MAILRDYKCPEHGYFTAWEAKCEHGCQNVDVVFLRPISIRTSGRTKNIDATLGGLASDYKMTDIKSVKEGDYQQGYETRNNAPVSKQEKEQRPGDAVMWGSAGKYNMASMLSGNAVPSVRGEQVGFNPKDANITRGPMAASYMADPDGLKAK